LIHPTRIRNGRLHAAVVGPT